MEFDQTGHQGSFVRAEGTEERQPVNDEGVQSEKPAVPSTSSYTSLDSTNDDVVSMSTYKTKNLHQVKPTDPKLAL